VIAEYNHHPQQATDPTPEEIARETAIIRAGWDEYTKLRRYNRDVPFRHERLCRLLTALQSEPEPE